MQLPRFVGLVDLGVATIVLVTLVLPPREMFAATAQKATEPEQFALALAEARTQAERAHRLPVNLNRRAGHLGASFWRGDPRW